MLQYIDGIRYKSATGVAWLQYGTLKGHWHRHSTKWTGCSKPQTERERRTRNVTKTPKTAKNTIIEINQFKKELKKISSQKYAFDDEEWFNGMVGVSVPIFNRNNELCFCLSTHTAKSRKNIDDLKKILPTMQTAAINLKKVLFKD